MQSYRKILLKNFEEDLKKIKENIKKEIAQKFQYVVSEGIDNLKKLKSDDKFACIQVVGETTILYRIQDSKYPADSLYFSTGNSSRFNFPSYVPKKEENKLGVSYLGMTLEVALLEFFGRKKLKSSPTQPRQSVMYITKGDLNRWNLLEISVKQKINLLDLTNYTVLISLGVDLSYILGPYIFTQYLSYLIHEELQDIDGIYYLSKTNSGPNIALYKRAENKVEIIAVGRLTNSYIYPSVKNILYTNGIKITESEEIPQFLDT